MLSTLLYPISFQLYTYPMIHLTTLAYRKIISAASLALTTTCLLSL